jgi:hypothetical protein
MKDTIYTVAALYDGFYLPLEQLAVRFFITSFPCCSVCAAAVAVRCGAPLTAPPPYQS